MVTGLILGLVFFLCTISAYSLGIKHGKQMSEKIVPNLNPIKAIKNHIENKEIKTKDDLVAEGMANIMRYDGSSQMKEGE
jgi:hypothetical protein